jgi:hypothetical protein
MVARSMPTTQTVPATQAGEHTDRRGGGPDPQLIDRSRPDKPARRTGTDLGFWFAQQGSILTFIVLIFYYKSYMNRLDKEFGVDEQ